MPERLTKEQAEAIDLFVTGADNGNKFLNFTNGFRPVEKLREGMKRRILDLLAERDTLLDILERLHSVQDGCPLHKYNTAWVKAMEDAQAAFDRAGGGPC